MRRIIVPAVWLFGCSIPDTQFKPSPDARAGDSGTTDDADPPAMVTDIAADNIVTLDEGQAVSIHVHLSNQPSGDVNVMVIVGSGPVTATPSLLVFTTHNHAIDQTVRFSSAIDANLASEDQLLTLRMGSVDKLYTLHSIDRDVLNIQVSPPSLTITENAAAGNLDVALTQQPAADVSVTVTTSSGHITTDKSQLTFTPQNYATNQLIRVSAPGDPDTGNDTDTVTLSTSTAGVLPRNVTVAINDSDVQRILDDVPGTLAVIENQTVTFGVTLAFKPTSTITVSVTSLDTGVAIAMPGVLQFAPADYLTPHLVTVRGSDDNNLAANATMIRLFESSIGMTDVAVNVADDDQQQIIVSASTLTIHEGTAGGFDVSLRYDPGTTVPASIANTDDTALPASPGSLTFTTSDFNQAHHVTISPPIDGNNVSEVATITISGAGAATPATVIVTAQDATAMARHGGPMPVMELVAARLGARTDLGTQPGTSSISPICSRSGSCDQFMTRNAFVAGACRAIVPGCRLDRPSWGRSVSSSRRLACSSTASCGAGPSSPSCSR